MASGRIVADVAFILATAIKSGYVPGWPRAQSAIIVSEPVKSRFWLLEPNTKTPLRLVRLLGNMLWCYLYSVPTWLTLEIIGGIPGG